jgi:hypothetical protein
MSMVSVVPEVPEVPDTEKVSLKEWKKSEKERLSD